MDHALLVGIINRQTNGREELHDRHWGREIPHPRGAADQAGQRLTLDISHDHVGGVPLRFRRLRDVEVVDLHNVWMLQGSNNLGLACKSCAEGSVRLEIGTQELDGDMALQLGVEGLPYFRHATMSQALL